MFHSFVHLINTFEDIYISWLSFLFLHSIFLLALLLLQAIYIIQILVEHLDFRLFVGLDRDCEVSHSLLGLL